jgi:uncharacterized protein YndB with AHSA1/START domain
MPVPPLAVWEALANPGGYGYWVAGSKVIRGVDGDWPEPGSRFHHTVGVGPFKVSDDTQSLEAEPPERLRMRARGRPVGTATVTLQMTPKAGGTVVRMTESPDGLGRILELNPLFHLFTRLRNAESLMRLEELAMRKAA